MESMELPGRGDWRRSQAENNPEYHLDPNKGKDPVEQLLEKVGPEEAFDELMERIEKNPEDTEARRQANLLANRLEDLVKQLREKTGH